MDKKVQIISLNLTEKTEVAKFLRLFYQVDQRVQFHRQIKISQVQDIFDEHNNGILIFTINTKEDLTNTLEVLKKYNHLIESGLLKSLCLLDKADPKTKDLLVKHHCTHVMKTPSELITVTELIDSWAESFQKIWQESELELLEQKSKANDRGLDGWISKTFGINLNFKKSQEQKEDLSMLQAAADLNMESGTFMVELKQQIQGQNVFYFCRFQDMFDDQVLLTIPRGTVLSEDPIHLKLTFEYTKKIVSIGSTVQVINTEKFDDIHDSILLQLEDTDSKPFEQFRKLIAQRQECIEDFLFRAKGY